MTPTPWNRLLAVTLSLVGSALLAPPAFAQNEILVDNYSFESSLTYWTQRTGTGGITADTTKWVTGTKSMKIVDNSTSVSWSIESNERPVTSSGTTAYVAQARVFIASGSAVIRLKFYDSSHAQIGSPLESAAKTAPVNAWTYISAEGVAPSNTAYATVTLCSGLAGTTTPQGTTYWDDVQLSLKFHDLGVQVNNTVMQSAAIGNLVYPATGHNTHKIYSLQDGAPGDQSAFVSIINLDTLDGMGAGVEANISLPYGAFTDEFPTGGWGAASAADGLVYFGTYPYGGLYRFTPNATTPTSSTATYLAEPYTAPHIRVLTPGPGNSVYGGTYETAAGGYFKYTPGTPGGSITGYGAPIWGDESYVQGLDYDDTTQISYLGVGGSDTLGARLIKYNHVTAAKNNIFPASITDQTLVYNVDVQGGRIFARTSPGNKLLVFNQSTDALISSSNTIGSMGVTPLLGNRVYFNVSDVGVAGAGLKWYDVTNDTVGEALKTDGTAYLPGFYSFKIGLAKHSPDALSTVRDDFPGWFVVGIGNSGGLTWVFKYSPTTGKAVKFQVPAPVSHIQLNNIGTGPDGKIYSSGYLSGGTGVYTPNRSKTEYDGVAQTYGMVALNGIMYFATYPHCDLIRYDPALGWNGTNARVKLMDLTAEEQGRPVALVTDGTKLFMGSIASSGKRQGALTIITPGTTAATTTKVVKTPELNQGISALTYRAADGKIYGGTTVAGGTGTDALSSTDSIPAKLFSFDPATMANPVMIALPNTGENISAVTAMATNPADGKIWILAEGWLLVYNPGVGFDTPVNAFPDIDYGKAGAWVDAKLAFTKSGHLYGTIGKRYFFRINTSTKDIIPVDTWDADEEGPIHLAVDDYDNVYYATGTHIRRYAR